MSNNELSRLAVLENQIKTIFDYIKDNKIRKNIYLTIIGGLLIGTIVANINLGRRLERIDIHLEQSISHIETLNTLEIEVPNMKIRMKNTEDKFDEVNRNDAIQDEKIGYLEQIILIERKGN